MDEFSRARQVGGGDRHMLGRTCIDPEIWRATIGLTTAQALLSRANSRRRLPRIAALSCQDFTIRSQTGTSIVPKGPAARPPDLLFQWGERGDSNPRHPGPQQCCHGEEALENPCLPGIPGPEVGIFTPVEGHLRPCRLPHSWPHSRSPRKLCSSAIRAGCDRSAITSASLQPIRPGTVRQRAGRE
jgi:hypothetical protein